jgi:hypothetical protein
MQIRLDTGFILPKMQLDILFLDIDGVLNPDKAKTSSHFAPECIAEVQRIRWPASQIISTSLAWASILTSIQL